MFLFMAKASKSLSDIYVRISIEAEALYVLLVNKKKTKYE